VASTPYVKSCSNGVDRIDFLATTDHPNIAQTSVYHFYAQWDPGSSALKYYDSGGTELTLPVSEANATLIYDGSTNKGWIWDVVIDELGRPHALLQKIFSSSDHRLIYTRWNGSAWTTPVQVAAMGARITIMQDNFAPGGSFDGNDPYRVYAAVWVGAAVELQEFYSADNGATWSKVRDITSGSASGIKRLRPYSPRGHEGRAAVQWMEADPAYGERYDDFDDYLTEVLSAPGSLALRPGTGHSAGTGYAPTITQGQIVLIEPGTGHAVASGYAPTISQGANITVTPGTGHAYAAGYAPVLSQSGAGTGATAAEIWAYELAPGVTAAQMVIDTWRRLGLDPAYPLAQTATQITAGGALDLAIAEVGGTVTVTRQ